MIHCGEPANHGDVAITAAWSQLPLAPTLIDSQEQTTLVLPA
jgi:hypothetical protein